MVEQESIIDLVDIVSYGTPEQNLPPADGTVGDPVVREGVSGKTGEADEGREVTEELTEEPAEATEETAPIVPVALIDDEDVDTREEEVASDLQEFRPEETAPEIVEETLVGSGTDEAVQETDVATDADEPVRPDVTADEPAGPAEPDDTAGILTRIVALERRMSRVEQDVAALSDRVAALESSRHMKDNEVSAAQLSAAHTGPDSLPPTEDHRVTGNAAAQNGIEGLVASGEALEMSDAAPLTRDMLDSCKLELEQKIQEVQSRVSGLEARCMNGGSNLVPDRTELERMIASAAARVVRDEIEALREME